MTNDTRQIVPWYAWPIIPIVFIGTMIIFVPLAILALLSIPYYFIYPDHHAQLHDFHGNAHQKKRLARWRTQYKALGLGGRIARARINSRRRSLFERTLTEEEKSVRRERLQKT